MLTGEAATLLRVPPPQNAGAEVAEVSRQIGHTIAAWRIISTRFGGQGEVAKSPKSHMH